MMKIEDLIASLPDPKKDPMPPRVMIAERDLVRAREEKRERNLYLDPKKDTESKVKYVLKSLLGADLGKDGDWVTVAGGREVWQKKVADLAGGIPVGGDILASYVEVKGVSPGNNFQLSRLDVSNNKNQPSQHEKLTKAWEYGYITWLALGFWDAMPRSEPVFERKKGKKYKKWLKKDVELTIYLIDWGMWVNGVLPALGERRSLRQKDRGMLLEASIYKKNNRWTLHHDHWLRSSRVLCSPTSPQLSLL